LPLSSLHPEDGGSFVLRNVGILPHYYTVSQPEDGDSEALRNLVSYHNTTRRHNTKDFDLNLHRRENIKYLTAVSCLLIFRSLTERDGFLSGLLFRSAETL
jgi:hypothetical protein